MPTARARETVDRDGAYRMRTESLAVSLSPESENGHNQVEFMLGANRENFVRCATLNRLMHADNSSYSGA